jgi:rSAM/selenodomain-associated transferase 2
MHISVIIPTLNEEDCLSDLLDSLVTYKYFEIIVADGGSADKTRAIALAHKAKFISSAPGRGIQQNQGAKAASGDVFLFLHADSIVMSDLIFSIEQALLLPGVAGGAFRLGINSDKRLFKLITAAANLRSRLLGLPFGDQGIFTKRELFYASGGFSNIPIMEDVDFIKRIKRRGKIHILNEVIYTSPRRWQKEGAIYCTLRNWLIFLLYKMGVPAHTLHKWYKNIR